MDKWRRILFSVSIWICECVFEKVGVLFLHFLLTMNYKIDSQIIIRFSVFKLCVFYYKAVCIILEYWYSSKCSNSNEEVVIQTICIFSYYSVLVPNCFFVYYYERIASVAFVQKVWTLTEGERAVLILYQQLTNTY